MIGLSPLSPGHRRTFQRTSVRPSTGSYPRFSLPRDSSPGFASAARDWIRPFRTRFRSGSLPSLTSPRASNSLAHSTKGTPSRDEARSDALRAHGFRYCFTLLFEVLFTFPSRYWSTIGLSGVFSLAGWSRRIHTGFLVSRATQDTTMLRMTSNTQLSCSKAGLSRPFFSSSFLQQRGPTTPIMP